MTALTYQTAEVQLLDLKTNFDKLSIIRDTFAQLYTSSSFDRLFFGGRLVSVNGSSLPAGVQIIEWTGDDVVQHPNPNTSGAWNVERLWDVKRLDGSVTTLSIHQGSGTPGNRRARFFNGTEFVNSAGSGGAIGIFSIPNGAVSVDIAGTEHLLVFGGTGTNQVNRVTTWTTGGSYAAFDNTDEPNVPIQRAAWFAGNLYATGPFTNYENLARWNNEDGWHSIVTFGDATAYLQTQMVVHKDKLYLFINQQADSITLLGQTFEGNPAEKYFIIDDEDNVTVKSRPLYGVGGDTPTGFSSEFDPYSVTLTVGDAILFLKNTSTVRRISAVVLLDADESWNELEVIGDEPTVAFDGATMWGDTFVSSWRVGTTPSTPATFADVAPFEMFIDWDRELLPLTYASPHEQIRVFFNSEEVDWLWDDGRITLADEPEPGAHSMVAFRETRSDRSWVELTPVSRLRRSSDLMTYYRQRLFILQELCEMQDVGDAIGHPVNPNWFPEEDDSPYSATFDDGETVNVNDLPFPLIKDPIVPPEKQIEVFGIVNDLEVDISWTVDSGGVISVPDGWNEEDWPIKVTRNTRLDKLWHTTRDASSFPSTPIVQIHQQLGFLIEESCGWPDLPDDHPLNNGIFPRDLNWLLYVGPGPSFFFGHMPWAGDGNIFVFVNDIQLQDHEWFFDWEGWNIVIPGLNPGDNVTFGPGGTGSLDPGGQLQWPSSDDSDAPTTPPGPISQNKEKPCPLCPPGQFPVVHTHPDDPMLIVSITCEGEQTGEAPECVKGNPCGEGQIATKDGDDIDCTQVPPGSVRGFAFTFENFQDGWLGEDGFGPAGWLVGPGVGLRFDHPEDDRAYIELYKSDCPVDAPPGVSIRVKAWTYARNSEGDWGFAHALTCGAATSTRPAWAVAIANWWKDNALDDNPIKQVIDGVDGSNFTDGESWDQKILQQFQEFMNLAQEHGFNEATLSAFNEWLNGVNVFEPDENDEGDHDEGDHDE
jgi:hypothetical protein